MHRFRDIVVYRSSAKLVVAFVSSAVVMMPSTDVQAQVTVTTAYSTGCGAGTGCGQVWFNIMNNGSADIALNSITVTRTSAAYAFSPQGGTGSYDGQDDISPLAGFTTVNSDGSQFFIDFINTGDPMNPGFPFTVFAGNSGAFETTIDPTALPQDSSTLQFSYQGMLGDGSRLNGIGNSPTTTTTPELPPIDLVATGLATLMFSRRTRRSLSRHT